MIILFFIRLYQKTLSPDHGIVKLFFPYGYCRFYPSCSVYTCRSIERLGVLQGLWRGVRRLLSCHPWSRGGIDFPSL